VQAVESQSVPQVVAREAPAPTSVPSSVPAVLTARTRLLQALGILAALGLGLLAQTYLTNRVALVDGLLFYAVALFLFVKVLAPLPMLQAALARPLPAASARATLAWPRSATVAAALAAVTFVTAGGNTVRPVTVVCWIGAVAATLYAAADPRPDLRAWAKATLARLRRPPPELRLHVSWLAVLVIGIVLLGTFYRFYQLDNIPYEPTSDHAEKFQDIQDLVDGLRPWFFPRNTGREPLQFYLALPVALLRGVDHLTLKLVTAAAGTVTVLCAFFLGRQFFGNGVGLLVAFFMAVGKWEFAPARVGLRIPFAPLFSTLCLYLLFRVLRYGQRRDYLFLGLGLGAGLYGYTPFRLVVPLFVTLAFALMLVFRWRDGLQARLDLIRNAVLCYVVAGVVFLPLGRYMVDYPQSFWERTLTRVTDNGAPVASPLLVFLGNLKNAALMFNWQGDIVWVNSVPNDPVIDPLMGALFVLGLVYALVRLVRYREWLYAYLLLAIPVLTLTSTAAISFPQENPSVLRAGPAIPVVYLLAALPLALAVGRVRSLLGRPVGRIFAAALLFVALALIAHFNYDSYFITYAEQYRLSARNSREIGQVVRGFAESVGSYNQAYHVPYPHWLDTRNIGTAAGKVRWNNALLNPDAVRAAAAGPTPQLYILHPDDQTDLAILRGMRPEGHAELHRSATPGHDFMVFFVPAPPG